MGHIFNSNVEYFVFQGHQGPAGMKGERGAVGSKVSLYSADILELPRTGENSSAEAST